MNATAHWTRSRDDEGRLAYTSGEYRIVRHVRRSRRRYYVHRIRPDGGAQFLGYAEQLGDAKGIAERNAETTRTATLETNR